MSRLELGGHEGAIPNIALPDPNLSADLPVQSLVLVDGVPFEKADWVSLGYTHYEVWCVGAAGGQGAEGGDPSIKTLSTWEFVPMPDWIWENQIQTQINQWAREGKTVFPNYEFSTEPGHTGEVVVTYDTPREAAIKWLAKLNPAHTVGINHHHDAFVVPYSAAPIVGGGGGGGGLHVMSGILADLPDSIPIVVGQVGVDAPAAQMWSANLYDPFFKDSTISLQTGNDIYYFTNTWPPVGDPQRPMLPPGRPGGDGGASAFGDICMASGGKGGGPAIVWANGQRMFAAHGGEGGVGGRLEAGGGAVGSVSANISGKDGTWDGTIGQGGGGGRGGMAEVKANALDIIISGV